MDIFLGITLPIAYLLIGWLAGCIIAPHTSSSESGATEILIYFIFFWPVLLVGYLGCVLVKGIGKPTKSLMKWSERQLGK